MTTDYRQHIPAKTHMFPKNVSTTVLKIKDEKHFTNQASAL